MKDALLAASEMWPSPAGRTFLEYVARHPECLERDSFRGLQDRSGLSPFPLQPWPAVVDGPALEEMEQVTVGLCRLIREVPTRIFDRDAGQIARYYGFSGAGQVRSMLARPAGTRDAVARGDFVWSAGGLQCLEINLASHLGGWRAPHWAESYLRVPCLAGFIEESGLDLRCRDTVRLLFEHMVAASRRDRGAAEGKLNVAVLVPPDLEAGPGREIQGFLDGVCRQVLAEEGLEGSVGFHGADELWESGGRLTDGDRTIHVVVEAHEDSTPAAVARCFQAGTLQLYNGTVRQLLSDKRNLALLSELADSGLFEARERRLIEDHVPWTRRLTRCETTRRGERIVLPDHAVEAREDLVLKDARFATSGKGRGVFVGSETPDEEWRARIERAVVDGGWVVQEWVPSLPFLFQIGKRGCAPHQVVWGLFSFGERYAGGFLSLRPTAESRVVNTLRGASGGVIFEASPAGHRREQHVVEH